MCPIWNEELSPFLGEPYCFLFGGLAFWQISITMIIWDDGTQNNKYGHKQSQLVMHLEMIVFFWEGPDHLTVFGVCPEPFSTRLLRFGSVALGIVDMHLVSTMSKGNFRIFSESSWNMPKQMMMKKQQCWSIDFSDFEYNLVPEMQEFSHCTLPTSALLWFN